LDLAAGPEALVRVDSQKILSRGDSV